MPLVRILGLDVGDRRIGVALSDPLGITAQPLETLHRTKLADDIAHIVSHIRENDVTKVVCGLPLHMDGREGEQAAITREFAAALEEACGIPIEFCDERLTTAMARRTLIEGGVRRDKRKQFIDKLAAVQILQTYLEMHP